METCAICVTGYQASAIHQWARPRGTADRVTSLMKSMASVHRSTRSSRRATDFTALTPERMLRFGISSLFRRREEKRREEARAPVDSVELNDLDSEADFEIGSDLRKGRENLLPGECAQAFGLWVAAKRAVSWRVGSAGSAAARQVTARAAIHRRHWFSRSPTQSTADLGDRGAAFVGDLDSAAMRRRRRTCRALLGGVDGERSVS